MTSEEEQAYEDAMDNSDWQVPPYDREYRAGAAVALGLMGMAEALARHYCCHICGDYPCDHRNAIRNVVARDRGDDR